NCFGSRSEIGVPLALRPMEVRPSRIPRAPRSVGDGRAGEARRAASAATRGECGPGGRDAQGPIELAAGAVVRTAGRRRGHPRSVLRWLLGVVLLALARPLLSERLADSLLVRALFTVLQHRRTECSLLFLADGRYGEVLDSPGWRPAVRLYGEGLGTHHARQTVSRDENAGPRLRAHCRFARPANGLLPVSVAAELRVQPGATPRHSRSTRSGAAECRRVPTRHLVESAGLRRLSEERHDLLFDQRPQLARRFDRDGR